MERTITFFEVWGKNSWKVKYDGPYDNNRFPHIEVGSENIDKHVAGEVYKLSNLHVSGKAIMWDVEDCKNALSRDGFAHFTVYFGPDAKKRINEFN